MKKILLIALCFLILHSNEKPDSLNVFITWQKTHYLADNWIAPICLLSTGFFTFKKDGFLNKYEVKELRDRYLPNFHNSLDDYSQYSPLAIIYALNLAGYKGKHEIGRFTMTMLMSAAITTSLVLPLKKFSNIRRPDQSASNAFPSGHTATAFMTATLLHEEYGKTKSPLFSVLAYSAAASTGVYRMLNNKHWISDVFVGGALGILATELSYEIMQSLYQDEQLNLDDKINYYSSVPSKPFTVDIKLSFSRSTGDLRPLLKEKNYFMKNGFSISAELNYFPWKNFGFGLNTSVASFPVKSNYKINQTNIYQYITNTFQVEAIGSRMIQIGPVIKFDLSKKFSIVNGFYFGWNYTANGKIKSVLKEQYQTQFGREKIDIVKYIADDSFIFNNSLKVLKRLNRYFSIGLYLEYSYSKPELEIFELNSLSNEGIPDFKKIADEKDFKYSYYNIGFTFSTTL
jgi:membrane-associated phospholipid phosphatase